jgi:hypothetical protein
MLRFDHGEITDAELAVHAGRHGESAEMSHPHWRIGFVSQITTFL